MKKKTLLKKICAACFCTLFVVAASASAAANSGPTYWEYAPSFSVTVLKDCPVTVEKENLTFDFSAPEQKKDYSPQAKVTALYQMENPSSTALKVRMAFPLIGSLSELGGVQITANGKAIPFQTFMGDQAAGSGASQNYYKDDGTLNTKNLSFDQIIKSVNENTAPLQKLTDTGKLYQISSGGKSCRLQVDFEIDPKKTAVLSGTGFNGFSFDKGGNGKIGLTGLLAGDVQLPLKFLVVGDDIKNLTVGAYQEGSDTEKLPGVTPKIETSSQGTKAFINEMMQSTSEFAQQYLSVVEKQIDEKIAEGQTVISDSILYDLCHENHVIALVYEVPFPANGHMDVTVSYTMRGAMNTHMASQPVYSYGYLLNPAKNWAKFQNLNITVIPPQKAPYVVNSSVALTKSGSSYVAKFPSLPQKDLVFSLYSKPQISADDKPRSRNRDPMITILTVFAIILGVILMFRLIRKIYHKIRTRKET